MEYRNFEIGLRILSHSNRQLIFQYGSSNDKEQAGPLKASGGKRPVSGSGLSIRCHVHTGPDNHLITYKRKIFDNNRTVTELRNVWVFTGTNRTATVWVFTGTGTPHVLMSCNFSTGQIFLLPSNCILSKFRKFY